MQKYTNIFCLKNTEPKKGISLRKGICIDLKIGASLSSGLLFNKWFVKKLVIPRTKMLIATPAIIWSTRNVTTSAANMNPNPPPTKIAKINPIKLPKIEPKRAPANAPANSIPSIPMFITCLLYTSPSPRD